MVHTSEDHDGIEKNHHKNEDVLVLINQDGLIRPEQQTDSPIDDGREHKDSEEENENVSSGEGEVHQKENTPLSRSPQGNKKKINKKLREGKVYLGYRIPGVRPKHFRILYVVSSNKE